jgi:hypothetical protein
MIKGGVYKYEREIDVGRNKTQISRPMDRVNGC